MKKIFLIIFFFSYYYLYYISQVIFNFDINQIDNDNIQIYGKYFKYKKEITAVYSALFGNYDIIKPFNKEIGFDYFLFTDVKLKINTNWTILSIPYKLQKLKINNQKKQRFIKLHPHLFFKDYKLSIYLDTSFKILGNLKEFLERLLSPKYNIYIIEHQLRKHISSECEAVKNSGFETKKIINLIKRKYKYEKFPDNIGLSENCLLVRYHNNKEVISLMEKWWKQILKYSHRDQLSFNYILWITGIKIKYFSWNFVFEYFYKNKTHNFIINFKKK